MIDSYIILNRNPKIIIKIFTFNLILIIVLIIWGINTYNYKTYFEFHSQLLNFDSLFYLEVLIPAEEVDKVLKNKNIIINNKNYSFSLHKIDENVTYKNNTNYQKLYLKIENLEKKYLINGYQMKVKFEQNNKKIIDYLKQE